jgi:hypothetical protein
MNKLEISLLLGTFLMPVVSYGSADFSGEADGQFAGVVVSDEALFAAIRAGNFGLVNYLIDHGANVNSREEEREYNWDGPSFTHYLSPLVVAIRTGNIDMVRLLLARGAKVNTQGGKHNVPLYEATDVAQPDVVRLLLEQEGININITQDTRMSYDEYELRGYGGESYDYQVSETALQSAGQGARQGGETSKSAQIVRLLRAHGAR